jgi:glycosyltransferase involved in cell wall biosynthesis
MKVAIVCDWLTGTGGAERVVLELHKMFPDAPIYTSQYNSDPKIWHGDKWFADADVRTGWLQKLPAGLKKFLPVFRAIYFSRLNLSEYDLVISSSGAEAKGVKTTKDTLHACYCHSPTHYYWSRYDDYIQHPGFGKWDFLARLGLKLLIGPMRRWDKKASARPDFLIANSTHTAAQIHKYYQRDATVIHPPVDVERFSGRRSKVESRKGFVVAGRQTPYKKIDLAVTACTKLGLPLKVIGSGPDHQKLRSMAGPTIEFLQDLSDKEIVEHFQSAKAFAFPGLDDFGIVAVEALAAGTPVIAYKAGGALDYINDGVTGEFFEPQTVDALMGVLEDFDSKEYDSKNITDAAKKFSPQVFQEKLQAYLSSLAKSE